MEVIQKPQMLAATVLTVVEAAGVVVIALDAAAAAALDYRPFPYS